MTSQDAPTDQAWAGLADLSEEEREARMEERYNELANLPEEERRNQMKAMAQAEYTLPEDKLRSFTVCRLRVWLRMDQEKAQRVVSSYDAVMDGMPAAIAMRRVGVVQTLAREFSMEDQDRLRALVPRVFADRARYGTHAAAFDTASVSRPAIRAKKPWWAFWRRG